ncbi:MAG: hypothetical protein Q4D57_06115, partial [Clostridia bacterium]|nr:hypothetical protein [Clostridia bacterium]
TADLEKSLELAKDFMIAHWLNIDSFEKSKDILDSEPIEGVLHPKVKEYLLSDPELLEFCEKENDDENVVDFLKVLMYMYKAAGKDVSKISELLKKKQKSAPAQPAQPAPAPTSTTPAQPAKPAQPAQPETKVTSLSDDELGKLLSKSAGDVIEYLNSLPGKKVETDLFGTIDVQTVRDIQDLQRKTDVLKWKLPVNDKFNGYKFKQDDFEVDFTNSFFKSMYYSFVLAQAAYATSEQRARVGLDEVDQEAIDYLTKIYLPFMEAHKDLYPIGYDKQGKERFITLVRGKLGKPAQPAQPAQHEAAPQDPRVGKINAYLGDTTHNNDELFKAFKSKNDPLTIIPAKIPAELQGRWDKAPQIEAKNKIVAMASYLINSVYGGLGEKAWEGFDKTSAFGKAIKDKIESVKKKRSGKKKK